MISLKGYEFRLLYTLKVTFLSNVCFQMHCHILLHDAVVFHQYLFQGNSADVASKHQNKPSGPHSLDTLFRAHWRDVCRLLHKR